MTNICFAMPLVCPTYFFQKNRNCATCPTCWAARRWGSCAENFCKLLMHPNDAIWDEVVNRRKDLETAVRTTSQKLRITVKQITKTLCACATLLSFSPVPSCPCSPFHVLWRCLSSTASVATSLTSSTSSVSHAAAHPCAALIRLPLLRAHFRRAQHAQRPVLPQAKSMRLS